MIPGDALIDAFINANILFVIGYVMWVCISFAMQRIGLKDEFTAQLRLLNVVFLAITVSPLVALGFAELQSSGFASGVKVNLSDIAVSYYLNGGVEMKASEFEALVLLRDDFTLNIMNGDGLLAQAVIALFLLGVAVGTVRLVYSIAALRGIVVNSYPWRQIGRVRISVSDRVLVPFSTRGLRVYHVVLPAHMIGRSAEVKVALAHEFEHIRQGDLEWEVLLESLRPFFFFNPAFRAWKRQVEHLRELRCDRNVLRRGVIDVRSYCETLLSICQKTLRKDRAFAIAVPKVTLVTASRGGFLRRGRPLLEQRIVSALDASAPGRVWLFAAIAVPAVAFLVLMTLAIQSPGDWSQDRLMLSTVVNLDRLDEINRLSTFGRQ